MRNQLPRIILILSVLIITTMFVAACSSSAPEPTATEELVVEEPTEEAEPTEDMSGDEPMEDMAGDEDMEGMEDMHDVPDEAAEVPNPISASDESVATGGELFATHCALCHGDTGEGDGPAASDLAEPPANLHEDHVQGLTDGALFYIISNGIADSPMPPWEALLDEDQRWHVVNFLRTFAE